MKTLRIKSCAIVITMLSCILYYCNLTASAMTTDEDIVCESAEYINDYEENKESPVFETLAIIAEDNCTASIRLQDTLDEKVMYSVPEETVINLSTNSEETSTPVTLNIQDIKEIYEMQLDTPDWDIRERYKDLLILDNILVDQLGVSKTVAAAIMGNVYYEDSFIALTSSNAHSDDIDNLTSRLGRGTRGFGIIQWTQASRQNCLESYYIDISEDLSWELTSIVSETVYLYQELSKSGILGELSTEGNLENLTGTIACEYEQYTKARDEWIKENGEYRSVGSKRYEYAKIIYSKLYE